MSLTRIIVLLVLIVAIVGGGGYSYYQFFVLPEKQVEREKQAAIAAEPTPTPDYSVADFDKIQPLQKDGKLLEARDAYLAFIEKYPNSSKLADAKKAVGDLNIQMLFSDFQLPNKETYTVVSGDALVKIATKTKSSVDMIYRANNLPNINLQIGQVLLIPKIQITVVINREAKTIELMDDGKLLKEYPILSFKGPGSTGGGATTTVKEKISMAGDKRVAFGSKEYPESDRWIMLGNSGITIKSAPAVVAENAVLPGGLLLARPDMDELFILVNRGAPVTIQ